MDNKTRGCKSQSRKTECGVVCPLMMLVIVILYRNLCSKNSYKHLLQALGVAIYTQLLDLILSDKFVITGNETCAPASAYVDNVLC